MIKLFAFDLDGTLLKGNQEIDAETVEFIKNLKNLNNIKYVLATGRNYDLVEGIVSKYDFDCDLILNNGHEFYSKDKSEHFTYHFDDDKIKKIIDIFLEYNFHLSIHSANGNKYIFMDREDYYRQHLEMSAKLRKVDIRMLLNSSLFSRDSYLKNTVVLNSSEQLKGLKILKVDAKKLDKFSNYIVLEKLQQIDDISYTSSYESYIEICDANMNKGKLLLEVAKKYNISPHEIAVFGDGDNDIEFIQSVPHSFAMGNAKDFLKRIASYTTSTNEEQGVLKGMNLILKKENLLYNMV